MEQVKSFQVCIEEARLVVSGDQMSLFMTWNLVCVTDEHY